MAIMNTGWSPSGQTQTSTTETPGFSPPTTDPNSMLKFAMAVAADKRRRQLAAQQSQETVAAPAARAAAPEPVATTREPDWRAAAAAKTMQDAQVAEAQARIQAAQEAGRPAPMRMLNGGPGISQGYVMDVNAMSGNQRKMFLPQSSSFAADAGGGGGGGGRGGSGGGGAIEDPLSDPYSDASRDLRGRGLDAAQIEQIRVQQQRQARGGN